MITFVFYCSNSQSFSYDQNEVNLEKEAVAAVVVAFGDGSAFFLNLPHFSKR